MMRACNLVDFLPKHGTLCFCLERVSVRGLAPVGFLFPFGRRDEMKY